MPTPVITHTQTSWAYQTSLVENIKGPSRFMTTLLFGDREEPVPTESIELSYLEGERYLAPFVELNAEAIAVGGRSEVFANVSAPNIRLKRPMDAYNAFLRRPPGGGMFITSGAPVAAARSEAIVKDAAYMVDLVENRLEWMACQMAAPATPVSGFIELSYQASEKANFRIRIPRSADMNATLVSPALWSESTANIEGDFHAAKRIFSKHLDAPGGVVVLGTAASNAFRANAAVKADLDKKNVSSGTLELQNQFNESGAIYLGSIYGFSVWEYAREYVSDAGAATPFIPTDKAVFLAGGNAMQENKIFYGAIPDHDAFEQGLFVGRRFSKSWKTPDPSVYTQLLHTRPLPMIRRPNGIYILDVL